MVQKAKEQAAKKLGVPGKILVPVENIITRFSGLEIW
jgi:hypothetical protein